MNLMQLAADRKRLPVTESTPTKRELKEKKS